MLPRTRTHLPPHLLRLFSFYKSRYWWKQNHPTSNTYTLSLLSCFPAGSLSFLFPFSSLCSSHLSTLKSITYRIHESSSWEGSGIGLAFSSWAPVTFPHPQFLFLNERRAPGSISTRYSSVFRFLAPGVWVTGAPEPRPSWGAAFPFSSRSWCCFWVFRALEPPTIVMAMELQMRLPWTKQRRRPCTLPSEALWATGGMAHISIPTLVAGPPFRYVSIRLSSPRTRQRLVSGWNNDYFLKLPNAYGFFFLTAHHQILALGVFF